MYAKLRTREIDVNRPPTPGVALPLAHRPDFQLGRATVRPSLRTVEGPDGSVTVEPRVMQVLLAFTDAGGAVMTRDDLLRTCWNGAVVGDDAVNRIIADLRRAARRTGAGFGIETIPRIGYRLTTVPESATAEVAGPAGQPPAQGTRRWLIGGALAAAVAIAGFGAWRARRPSPDPHFADLLALAEEAVFRELPGSDQKAVEYLQEALAIRENSAAAWGLLALAQYSLAGLGVADAAAASARSADRALQLDAREANAAVALALLQSDPNDGFETELRLRRVLAHSPESPAALDRLSALLQGAGDVEGSWRIGERAIQADRKANRLRPGPSFRKALRLWIRGQDAEAERFGQEAWLRWQPHPYVWQALLLVRAMTGRWQAARDLLHEPSAQRALTPAGMATWEASLKALQTREPGDIKAARDANLASAGHSRMLGVHAALVLSELAQVDAAYSVIEGLLLRSGPVQVRPVGDGEPLAHDPGWLAHDPGWLQAHWLFTPAMQAVHADPRFAKLRRDIGLARYWERRGEAPPPMPWAASRTP